MRNRLMEQGTNIRQSKLGFLGNPPQRALHGTTQPFSNHLTDEIFLKGLKNSSIGRISGRQQDIKQLDIDCIMPTIEEEQMMHKRNRINFSQFKGIPTSRIYKNKEELKQLPKQHKGLSKTQLLGKQTVFLRSLTGKDSKELLSGQGCWLCSNNNVRIVKIVLLNESSLQIYGRDLQEKELQNKFTRLQFHLNFDTVKVEVHFDKKQINNKQLAIEAGQYRILLQHESRDVIEDWYNKIQSMNMQSKGREFKLKRLLSIQNFYLRRFQTQEYFVQNCQTGDVILFQDDHFFAKVQRFVTRSDFDHVAMVIRDQNYGLLLFESNSGSGVSLVPWRSVIRFGWYENIPRIAWRRLIIQRDDKFNQTIQKFVKDNLQKDYHISFAKITAQVSMIHAPAKVAEKSKEQAQQQGFFCSELVATIYKQLNLLTRDTSNPNYQPACKFYPKDFSDRAQRKLDKGQLSPEIDIFFDKNLLKLKYKHLIRD